MGLNGIHPTAIIYPGVTIGQNCYIGAYCVIGAPPEWKGREENPMGVVIGDDVIIHAHVTIDAGANGATYIGSRSYIMKGVHIGHDSNIHEGCTLSCHTLIGGSVTIGTNTNMGMGSIVHQGVFIPSGCMVGMGAVITKKTVMRQNGVYVGNPAKYIRDNDKH